MGLNARTDALLFTYDGCIQMAGKPGVQHAQTGPSKGYGLEKAWQRVPVPASPRTQACPGRRFRPATGTHRPTAAAGWYPRDVAWQWWCRWRPPSPWSLHASDSGHHHRAADL